ncbi:membrane protein [Microbulbifer sp. GL-2]|nr:membrane protein [Microbulbifer sp. GL-2]
MLPFPPSTAAHEVRPAYLQIEQLDTQRFDVIWRVPARGQLRLSLNVRFGQGATTLNPPSGRFQNGFYTERWQIQHPGVLSQLPISIDGLEHTLTDVLVRIAWLEGHELVQRLMPDRPHFVVSNKEHHGKISITYFNLGLEHILLGLDHLLFVLALMLLCSGWQQLLLAVTGFTLAHSITLGAATLGHLSLPQAPVEVLIALSIVFVASETLAKQRGRSSLATRLPWLMALIFGLLHGLGFAGALADIGLPQTSIPLALLTFNLGVEAGQLVFIAVTTALLVGLSRTLRVVQQWRFSKHQRAVNDWEEGHVTAWIKAPLAYSIGGIACYWCLERILSLLL